MQNLQFAVQRQKRQIYDSKRHDIATQFKLLIRKPLIFFNGIAKVSFIMITATAHRLRNLLRSVHVLFCMITMHLVQRFYLINQPRNDNNGCHGLSH